jgi:hypothetical protein
MTEQDAQKKIQELIETYHGLEEEGRKAINEDSIVTQFIEPLFRALGWPIENPQIFKKQEHTKAGKPDMTLRPESGGLVYIEAKRFGILPELPEASTILTRLVLPKDLPSPGMHPRRSTEEEQAIRYAYQTNQRWAILTNFERLRVYDAVNDWMIIAFEHPSTYLKEFQWLWRYLAYENLRSNSLAELSSERFRSDVDEQYLELINAYREKLAQDIVRNAEQNHWAFLGEERINLPLLRDVVQRFIDRLVVIRYAEDQMVMEQGYLKKRTDSYRPDAFGNSYGSPLTSVLKEFFRGFDQEHNSSLFAYDPVLDEQAHIENELLFELIDALYKVRFRAMSPDIMGNTYEQYLGKTLIQSNGGIATRDNLETRKKQGSYYTPQVIVRYLVDQSLGRILYGTENGRADGKPLKGVRRKSIEQIKGLRVLDPACGSGSFLIYAYEVLAGFYRAEIERLDQKYETTRQELIDSGEANRIEIDLKLVPIEAEKQQLSQFPQMILEQHLYGLDLDPQAAEIAAVNLIFRAMIDQRLMGRRDKLPLILNQNIKCGNGLIGRASLSEGGMAPLASLRRLRADLTADSHNQATHQQIAQTASGLKADFDVPYAARFTEPAGRRIFHWAVEFPECFVDEDGSPLGDQAGFDVIIGNPPWEIVKPDVREYYAQFDPAIENPSTPRAEVEKRIKALDADPVIQAGWAAQQESISQEAAYYNASQDYTRQGRGDRALHKLFMERVWGLLKHAGRLGYIVPSGIYTDLGTKDLRAMLMQEGGINTLIGLSNVKGFFPDVDSRFKFTLLSAQKGVPVDSFKAAFRIDLRVGIGVDDLPAFTANPDNFIRLDAAMIRRFSPDSLSIMEFQSERDYEVAEKIYGGWPLIGETTGVWDVKFTREFDMTNDRHLFNQQGRGLPLYQGGMFHQYNAHFAEPEYWLEEGPASQRLAAKYGVSPDQLDYLKPRLVFRDIARGTDERTLISAMLPPGVFCGNKAPCVQNESNSVKLYVSALFNSFVLDYIMRHKISTTMNFFYLETAPLPRLIPGNPTFDALIPRAARLTCTRAEFADLWQEVMGKKWKESDGAASPSDRQRLRDEIDALVAHLYGLTREDFEHLLGGFPLVFPADTAGQSKKQTLLAVYDEFASQVAGRDRAG